MKTAAQTAPAISGHIAELAKAKRDEIESRLRSAIERHTNAEASYQQAKQAIAQAPTDNLLVNNLREARVLLADAQALHEAAELRRDFEIEALDAAAPKLAQLSALYEQGNDDREWLESAKMRADAAVTELCSIYIETRQRAQRLVEHRAAVRDLANECGLNYAPPAVDFDRMLGVFRRAGQAAVERARLNWKDVRDSFLVGY